MIKRKSRLYEHTCKCSAYKFPHRFDGGRCDGFDVVKDQWILNFWHGDCANCSNLYRDNVEVGCNVYDRSEPPKECPVYMEFVEVNEIRIYK